MSAPQAMFLITILHFNLKFVIFKKIINVYEIEIIYFWWISCNHYKGVLLWFM